ncbi:HDOD domain-containing protein [Alteromonas facilis]|uniref:HDOD domain-containing protein n=1 Tax=Alteromonas facilis TaxID=2048004 RepID=UPI000C288A10|nr:HDOD domain-containing protein [Alteromonas facilis]
MITLDNTKLEKLTTSFQIPTKPEILTELNSSIRQTDADIAHVANIISKDVGLSSSILKAINSPAYGLNRQISEIEQATVFLGLKTIETIATTIKLKESIKGKSCISLERFWDDALDVAEAMRFVGERVKHKVSKDSLYTLGLFHDCGIPLMSIRYDDYRSTLIEANQQRISLPKLEMKKYNTSHAVIGYFVAVSWNLPKDICNIILRHHDPRFLTTITDSPEQVAYSVLKVAENIVNKSKRFNVISDWSLVDGSVLDVLSLSECDYNDLEEDYASLIGSRL